MRGKARLGRKAGKSRSGSALSLLRRSARHDAQRHCLTADHLDIDGPALGVTPRAVVCVTDIVRGTAG
jgi:hypothetical protein